jgi:hypothetical protein
MDWVERNELPQQQHGQDIFGDKPATTGDKPTISNEYFAWS